MTPTALSQQSPAAPLSRSIMVSRGTLVILSGLPGSGKSTIAKGSNGLHPSTFVVADAIRDQLLGNMVGMQDGRPVLRVRNECNDAVFAIMKAIVRERLVNGLTTVVDATNLNDAERKPWVEMADAAGRPHLVVIVATPLEECLDRMRGRKDWVSEARIREMDKPPLILKPEALAQVEKARANGKTVALTEPTGFVRSSRFNHVVVDSTARLRAFPVQPLAGQSNKTDVVGDIHGLLGEALQMLSNAGWKVNEEGRLRHPDPDRRLLFLGDLVDRGPHSLELLELVRRACADGLAQCLMGNHELKLLKFHDVAQAGTMTQWTSYANSDTGMKLMRLPEDKRELLVNFMRTLPDCIVHETPGLPPIAFVHADIHDFDPQLSLSSDLIRGQSGPYTPGGPAVDSDEMYEEGIRQGVNKHLVIRGHIPPTSKKAQEHIISLEKHGFQQGELMLLPMDRFVELMREGATAPEAMERCVLRQSCQYDFTKESALRFELIKGLEDLVGKKLARRYTDDTGLLRGFKYSKSVYFNGNWDDSQWLKKARGIVLDVSGRIVSHPFDKVFNVGEQGAGRNLHDDDPIVEVTKLNGFLGVISAHPIRRGELLIHTQGMLDQNTEAIGYIKELLDPKTEGLINAFLAAQPMTLLFEVIHPKDSHIIAYPAEMMGLHLIGARGLNQRDMELPEHEVDRIGEQLGLRRPSWKRCTWGEAKADIAQCQHEGFMVREDTAEQAYVLKGKSPFYLTAKFLGRLSTANANFMWAKPEHFKRTIDEELYPIVDAIVGRFEKDEFLAIAHEDRVPLMREMIAGIDFTKVKFSGRSRPQ